MPCNLCSYIVKCNYIAAVMATITPLHAALDLIRSSPCPSQPHILSIKMVFIYIGTRNPKERTESQRMFPTCIRTPKIFKSKKRKKAIQTPRFRILTLKVSLDNK